MRRYVVWSLTVTAMVAIAVGLCIVYRAITQSLLAEKNLHATCFVVCLVDDFVEQNGRWPRSWQELESVSKLDKASVYDLHFPWPAASDEIRKHVQIDFDVDLATIASQESMDFTAIRPIGPYFEYRDMGRVESLQKTLRSVTKQLR